MVAPADTLARIAQRLASKTPAQQAEAMAALAAISKFRLATGSYKSPEQVKAEAELAIRAKKSLKAFVQATWSIVEPDQPLAWNWHLDVLCGVLERVTKGEIDRLLINVPPGTMKSLLVSVFWPCWEWGSQPGLRYLTASYGQHLTVRDNLRVRMIITSDWYQRNFELRLLPDQNEKTLFKTTKTGWRFATSVGGAGTGEHPNRIIIDDPHTAEQARSDVERARAIDWFKNTISTRGKMLKVRIVVIMQRLHEMDLSGYLLSLGGWVHVMWPMRFEAKRRDAGDQRVSDGELLWAEKFPEQVVRELERDLGPYGAAGQLQQRPTPEGGGLFKRADFDIVDAAPAVGRMVRFWDIAATEDGGDWTVGTKMLAAPDGLFYVVSVIRGQWGAAQVDQVMKQTAIMDGRNVSIREEQEPGSSGKAVIAARAKLLVGYDYAGVSASGDKVTRALPFRAQSEARNVKLLRGDWNEAWLSEVCTFPVGAHDDQVDSAAGAFNEHVSGPRAVKKRSFALG